MKLCNENNFDILLTIDKNIQYQQNINEYNISIAILNSKSSKVEDLIPFLPKLNEIICDYEKGKIYLISKD